MNDLATLRNPFRDDVVQDAWQSPADVSGIHSATFEACLAVIEAASRNVPDSLLVCGPAGSGKTHLLTRVQRHLAENAKAAPDRVLRCLFVFVRLQTSPQLLWQHVRKRLAHDLMRRDEGVTQLQRLIAHQIGAVRGGASPRAVVRELRVLGREGQSTLSRDFEAVAQETSLPRDLTVVLEKLMYDESIRDAAAWLAGESLPGSVLDELGVGFEAEDPENASRELVTALCRLAPATLPVVFCFDQVEALQRGRDDRDAFFAFGRMAADLHDADRNVCLITCLQSALFEDFNASVRDADRDRIAKRRSLLEPLTKAQVSDLVRARLALVPELARPDQPFHPLGARLVDELARESPCVARKVLSACARRFEELQRRVVVAPPTTPEFLAAQLEERARDAARSSVPTDTTRIVLHGIDVIAELGELQPRASEPVLADALLERNGQKIALSVRNEADGRSLGPKLKRLLASMPRKDGSRLVVLRDPRLPISKNAKKTRDMLRELTSTGARLVEPSVAALSALSALSSILSDAKSGDLAIDGTPVAATSVLEWLRAHRDALALEPVTELVNALTEERSEPAVAEEEEDLAELVGAHRVVSLGDASRVLGHSVERLLAAARQRPEHFLVLEGPPVVIADIAGIAPESAR